MPISGIHYLEMCQNLHFKGKCFTGCWGLIWPLKFLTSTKYTFLKLLGHEDSSGVCSFVQSHPYFFTIVRAFSFQLKLAYFPWISRIFKNMLLGRDGFGKKHVCHVILYTLRISKKYVTSVLEIWMVISFPRTLWQMIFGTLFIWNEKVWWPIPLKSYNMF